MNSHVHKYYRKFVGEETPIPLFHDVVALHDEPTLSWSEISKKVPSMPRGWYELAHLNAQDRIEFVRDFWQATLPFVPHIHTFIRDFFFSLDDIGIYAYQWKGDQEFACEVVYSLKDGSCFYHGGPPCDEKEIGFLNHHFDDDLPQDYLSFLRIHNGFSKHTDTGILKAQDVVYLHKQIEEEVLKQNLTISCRGQIIDPKDLVPFYESFGLRSYQCFFREWYPDLEMGNVYFSPIEKVISDFLDQNALHDTMAFSSFLDWLAFYLEEIE